MNFEPLVGIALACLFTLLGVVWQLLLSKIAAGEIRIQLVASGLGELRVKLAENYHDTAESRQMVQDLIAPLKEQLDRIERLMIRTFNKSEAS